MAKIFHSFLFINNLVLCLLFISCAGYKFKEKNNLLKKQGATDLVIDEVKNETPFVGVGKYFTRSIFKHLGKVNGINLKNNLNGGLSEALVFSRLFSDKSKKNAISPEALRFISAETGYADSIGSREGFYLNFQVKYSLALEILIIKNPLVDGENVSGQKPQIIFQKIFPIQFSFVNNLTNGSGVDGAGAVNYVMNRSLERVTFEKQAKLVSRKIRNSLEF